MGINAVSAKLKGFFAKNKREVYIVGTDILDDVRCTCICATTENIVDYQQEGGFPDRVVACIGAQHHTKSRIENNSLLVELFTVNLMQHNRAPHVLHHI